MSILQMALVWKKDLNESDQHTLLALADHARDDGTKVFPSVAHLAWKLNVSTRTIQRRLKSLHERGALILVREAYDSHPREWRLDLSVFEDKTPWEEVRRNGKGRQSVTPSPDTDVTPPPDTVVSPEPSVEPSEEPSTLEESDAKATERTPQQNLMDIFYDRLREKHGIRLTKGRYSFHLGKFRDILNIDNATEEEQSRVIDHMVEVYAKAPKINAVDALADVRLGRDTGEAWSGPAPWEEADKAKEVINPHGDKGEQLKDKPRKPEWYKSTYPWMTWDMIDEKIARLQSHTEILEEIDG